MSDPLPNRLLCVLLVLLGWCFWPDTAIAQPVIDSLRKAVYLQLEEGKEADLPETYFQLGRAYLEFDELDSAYWAFSSSSEYAFLSNNPRRQYEALVSSGQIRLTKGDYLTALDQLLRAQRLLGTLTIKPAQEAQLMISLGNAYMLSNNYQLAMDCQMRSIKLAESINDTSHLAFSLLSLGSLYWEIGQYQQSMETYQRAYRVGRQVHVSHFTYLSSLSIAFFSLGELDSALFYIRKARSDAREDQSIYGEAYSLGLTGNILMEKGRIQEAIDSLKASIEICRANGFNRDAISFLNDLGKAYGMAQEYELAIRTMDEAGALTSREGMAGLLASNYRIRSEIYALQGDSARAFVFLRQHYALKDSIVNQEVLRNMSRLENDYEITKREYTIMEQKEELEASKRMLYVYGFGSGIVFLLVILYMAYVRNKTLREINQLLEDKNAEIRRQNDRLGSSNEDLRQFAHVASHDLREPLRNISSFSTLLARRYKNQLDKEAEEYLTFITEGAKRMDRLLNDLLTYSVIGVFDYEYSQVEIGKVVGNILRRFQQDKTLQGARISIPNLPTIRANAQQMDQLFTQLIDNAIKFRSEEKPMIEIRAEATDNGYIFSVKDNGIGMEEAYKEKIFALFLRLHNQQSAYQGSGIGLSIVKKIVEQHEGRIWIESELGVGTTVFFFLPTNPPVDPTPVHIRDRWQWLQEASGTTESREDLQREGLGG